MELNYEIGRILPIDNKLYKSFSIVEDFTPYSPMQLLKSGYFTGELESFASLYMRVNHDSSIGINNENIYADISDVLLDMVFVINQLFLFENKMYFEQLSCLENINYSKELKIVKRYLAIYTHLLEIEFCKIKMDLSALYYLLDCKEKKDAEKICRIIGNKYSLQIDTTKSLASNIYFLNTKIISNHFKIDIWDLKRFMELLQAYKPNGIDFLKRSNCFCLVHEGPYFYFSISGYKPDLDGKYEKVAKQIEKNLKAYAIFSNIQYCPLSDDTPCFGYIDNVKNFKPFDKPIKYKDCNKTSEISYLFSCCERKIIPFLTHLSKDIIFYCKYKPCCLCEPALEDEKNIYKSLRFLFFAKDPKQFHKYINKNKEMILKEYSKYNK